MRVADHNDMALAEEAAEWLVLLTEEDDAADRARFVEWLKKSPRHVEEFLLVSASRELMSSVDPDRRLDIEALVADAAARVTPFPTSRPTSGQSEPLPTSRPTSGQSEPFPIARPVFGEGEAVPATRQLSDRGELLERSRVNVGAVGDSKPRRRRVMFWASAAAALCLIAVGTLFWPFATKGEHTYATHVGEQRAFRLTDGSVLHLNTQSRARIEFSERSRDVRLEDGEALFTVRRDTRRPFRVLTRNAVVLAVGTQFNVYERENETRVSVVEGRVKVVDHDSPPVFLSAGEEASISTQGRITRASQPHIDTAVAWRQRRLAFHGATLAEVVEQFNRYNELQIRIDGEASLERRITAVFNADEPEALLQFLEREPSVRVQRAGTVATVYRSTSTERTDE